MKRCEIKRMCGRPIEAEPPSPAQQVLGEHGEIFSCGGVYLGLNRPAPKLANRFECLHLPTHRKEVLVLNNQKVHRRPMRQEEDAPSNLQENSSPEDALRRFFKESLN